MRLLDRQARLLDYLTGSGAIFGEGADATPDPALHGIDPGLLRLEARFSHEKRMDKIIAVFPKTWRLLGARLGARRAALVTEFVRACPPAGITRVENGRQFLAFLCARWRLEPPQPPWLEDVAACEFAIASARAGAARDEPADGEPPQRAVIRRRPDAVLLRCAHDIRPVVESDAQEAAVARRDTLLAIATPPGAAHPGVFEVPPPVFDFLAAIDDWTGRSGLGAAPEVDALIGELVQHGLVEARG